MIVTDNISQVRAIRWAETGRSWGLVPTMGYLHLGHLSLVQRAKRENDKTAVTIYVNPAQFAPTEDLSSYPRNLERDLTLLQEAGVDVVFIPNDGVMYPAGFQTYVSVEQVAKPLEGSSRPTHFRGVATVVAKLFNILQPTRVYFGQKDAQQTAVLRRMCLDLNFNLELIVCPTVREPDGLAMSSRNSYLTPAQRQAAPVLYRALGLAQAAYEGGQRDAEVLRHLMQAEITAEPLARLDYVSAADPLTLTELQNIENGVLFSTAVFFGKTRLIDNILLEIGG